MEPWQLAIRHAVLYGAICASAPLVIAAMFGLITSHVRDARDYGSSVDLSDWPDAEYAQKVVRPGHKGAGPLKSFHSGQPGTDIKHE